MVAVGRRLNDALLSPVSPQAASGQIALAGLRLLAGFIWLYNVVWKLPPDFGENTHGGLYSWTHRAIEHPVFPPFSWAVEHLVLPNFVAFGWGVLLVETALAVLLLTGTAVRVAALLGVAQSTAIALSVAESPGEWPWAYAMMIGIHVVLLFTPSARYVAVDAVRSAAAGSSTGARRLLGGWGVALGLISAVALWLCLSNGGTSNVGIKALEFSLGDYNLRGAVLLAGIALGMLTAATLRQWMPGLAAAVVALAAAISIYAQIGHTSGWLGGTLTTAAVFVCAAVIGIATRTRIRRAKGA